MSLRYLSFHHLIQGIFRDHGLKVATERLIMGGHECVFIAQWVKFKEHGEIWDYFKTFALKDYYPQERVLNNSQN